MPKVAGHLLRSLPQWGIRQLMYLFALLIIIDLVALAILILGNLVVEPVVLMLDANASTNNYTTFNISQFINNCSIINNYEITKNSAIISLEFWTIYRNLNALSLITFLAALLLGMIFASIFKKEKGLLVLPFNVEISKDKSETHALSGRHIQDQFIANLNKILWIHRIPLKGIDPEKKIYLENIIMPRIDPKSESPTYDLSKLGTISTGSIGLSIGEILMILRKICPGAEPGTIIKGDLYQSCREIRLTATIGPESTPKGSYSWSICGSLKGGTIGHKKIFDLLNDLCYQIAYEFLPPDNSINDWMGFKYFTEARFAYRQFTITKDGRSLDSARDFAFKAANLSPKYENIFVLIYNLGIAYLNEKRYKEAEALFRMNVILNRESDDGYRGWGTALRRLGMNDMALICFNKANEILKEKSELHKSHKILVHEGILYRNQKNYGEAIKSFEKALVKDPNFAFAWGHMGNTLEAKSRYFRLKTIYKLFEFMKEKNFNKIKKLKEKMDLEDLSEEEALQELVMIASESLPYDYKYRDLKESLDALGHAIGKNRMARKIEVKFRSLKKECRILVKSIRKTTPGAREFEDKCISSAKDLINLVDENEELLGNSGKRLKMECNSICDQCKILPTLLRDNVVPWSCYRYMQHMNDMKKKLEDAGEKIERHWIVIKENALYEMQAAGNRNEIDANAVKVLSVANLIEEKGRVLKDKIKTLTASTLWIELDESKSESEDIIKKSWHIRSKCLDLDELLSEYQNEKNSEKEIEILDKNKKEVEDLSEQCKHIREIFKEKRKSSSIKAIEIAEGIENHDKKGENDKEKESSLQVIAIDEIYASLKKAHRLLSIPIHKRDALEEKVLIVLGLIAEEIDTHNGQEIYDLAKEAEDCKKKALEAYLISINLDPEFIVVRSSLARLYEKDGQIEKRDEECKDAEKLIQKETEYNRTCHYAICGHIEDAFEPLRRALLKKQTTLRWLEEDPDLEELHKDSRFAKLREECKSEEKDLISGVSRLAIYRKLHEDEQRNNECTKLRQTIKSENLCNLAIFEAICNNDLEKALGLLEDALKVGLTTSDALLRDPNFDIIRDEPEFRSLLEKYTPQPETGLLAEKL